MPKALVEAARERDFPLFEVPYELPFIALTEKAFTRLVNEQYALLQRSIAAQERLQRIVLSERGLDAIVGALATLIGGPALVFDGRGELQAMRTFRRELDPEVVAALGEELRERARRGDGRGFVPGHPDLAPRALALPIASGEPPRTPPAPARCRRRGWWRPRTPTGWPRSTGSSCTRPSPSSRSSCCAAAWPTRPSAGWPATCSRPSSPASSRAPTSRGAWSPSASAGA